MILSRLDLWFTLFIFLVWILSTFLEYQRKAKQKQRRDQSARRPEQIQDQAPESDLQQAEREVHQHKYRPIPVGQDMEVNLEDLLEKILYETQAEDSSPELSESEVHSDRSLPSETSFKEPQISQTEISGTVSTQPKEEKKSDQTREFFPGGIKNAIIAKEILDRPLALRRKRARF